ncbi:MAG: bifunctional adenosylcobinamide kinase/adenosylcobinamide-phosphate guanylyltransferase [Actinomycetota bacterium]|nr:bifunctional adenosylcobinamide kinase/adenosylcobinamide-phosphate guanylyltransferase [Actinomycetota bacterium]
MTLLVGGARSGKSTIGQRLAAAAAGGQQVVVVVTADPSFADEGSADPEMVDRIRAHRADRPTAWATVEAPIDLARALTDAGPTVLVDCVTVWLSNLMLGGADDIELAGAVDVVATACAARAGATIVITNDVGSGIVPMEALSRRFRDAHGRMNQRLAAVADRSFLVVAGRLLELRDPIDHLPELTGIML